VLGSYPAKSTWKSRTPAVVISQFPGPKPDEPPMPEPHRPPETKPAQLVSDSSGSSREAQQKKGDALPRPSSSSPSRPESARGPPTYSKGGPGHRKRSLSQQRQGQ